MSEEIKKMFVEINASGGKALININHIIQVKKLLISVNNGYPCAIHLTGDIDVMCCESFEDVAKVIVEASK